MASLVHTHTLFVNHIAWSFSFHSKWCPLSQCRIWTAAAVYFKKLVFYSATRVKGENCQSLPRLLKMACIKFRLWNIPVINICNHILFFVRGVLHLASALIKVILTGIKKSQWSSAAEEWHIFLFYPDGANFNRNSRDLCASWNLAGCIVSKICSRTLPLDNIFSIIITGFHGNCQDLLQTIKACKAILTFFPCSLSLFFFPSHVSCHHDSCLLTFSRPSFLSLQPRFKGHGFPFLTSDDSHGCKKKSSFFHTRNCCLFWWFGGKKSSSFLLTR